MTIKCGDHTHFVLLDNYSDGEISAGLFGMKRRFVMEVRE